MIAPKDNDNIIRVDFGKKCQTPKQPTDIVCGPDTKQKYEVFCELIKDGMVMVTLDARLENVRVPPQFAECSDLRLNFAHGFKAPDFSYDLVGVRAYLSFDEGYFFCDVPWNAVFGFYSHTHDKGLFFDPIKPKAEKQPTFTLVKE